MNAIAKEAPLSQSLATAAEPALPSAPIPFGMSPQSDQVIQAVGALMPTLFSPFRDKTADVFSKRTGKTFTYRYVSLGRLTDMLREPMADQGLFFMHFMKPTERSTYLLTRLYHKPSGQYFESAQLLRVFEDDANQGFGSAVTYAKRYAICSMLNIAADDDDDANVADGNVQQPGRPAEIQRSQREKFNRLSTAARIARKPAEIRAVLQAWHNDADTWEAYRDRPEEQDKWAVLVRELPDAIERVHGPEMGASFKRALLATGVEAIDSIRELWEGAWRPAAIAMRESNPGGVGLLAEHMRSQTARLLLLEQRRARGAPDAADPQAPAKPDEAFVTPGPYLFDEYGEVASDRVERETDFAKMYVVQFQSTENTAALEEHNADGLAWCRRDLDARAILMLGVGTAILVPTAVQRQPEPQQAEPEPASPPAGPPAMIPPGTLQVPATTVARAQEPAAGILASFAQGMPQELPQELPVAPREPQPPLPLPLLAETRPQGDDLVVPMPRKARTCTPDLGGYLKAVQAGSARVSAEQMPAWFRANLPTFNQCPPGTRLACMAVVTSRMEVLGINVEDAVLP